VTLVDEHRTVLGTRNVPSLDRVDHGGDEPVEVVGTVRGLLDVIKLELIAAPAVKVANGYAIAQPTLGNHVLELRRECDVEAEHENRLAQRLGQPLASITQDQRFAGTRRAMDDTVSLSEATCQLLLLKVHDAHQCV